MIINSCIVTLGTESIKSTLDLSLKFDEISQRNFSNATKAHQEFFKWNNKDREDLKCVNDNLAAIEFTKTGIKNKQDLFVWTNQEKINVSGIPSRQRILIIRDITQHLKQHRENERRAFFLKFQLDETDFIIELKPNEYQPGNGLFGMAMSLDENAKSFHYHTHQFMGKFQCFTQLTSNEIERSVTSARQKGTDITTRFLQQTIQDIGERVPKELNQTKIAEELTFYMLELDFEVARRLQPIENEMSEQYDSLPIGIGIAIQHYFQKIGDGSWEFKSELFKDHPDLRKAALGKIIDRYQMSTASSKSLTKGDWTCLLYEKFGSNETSTAEKCTEATE